MKETLNSDSQDLSTNDAVIRYRLYRICDLKGNEYYQIQCIFRDENLSCAIDAQDTACVQDIYSRIVQGKVTPCTMREVLEDLRN